MVDQGSQESKDFTGFKKHMRNIRNSDYRATFMAIRKDLGLKPKTSDYMIEALLIHATRERFGDSLDADMVLSAFGLLKGFDNQHDMEEAKGSDTLITARRKLFIKESSYVADRHGPHNKRRKVHYQSYSELKAAGEDAINAVLSALGSEDGQLIDDVAQTIYSHKIHITSYLEESEKYLDTGEGKCIRGVKLQDLIHVNRDIAPSAKDGADGGRQTTQGGTGESEFCEPAPKQIIEPLKSLLVWADYIAENYKKILIIIVAIFFGITLIIVALSGTIKHTKTITVYPDGFQEDPRIGIQEWTEEYAYIGRLAKEHVD